MENSIESLFEAKRLLDEALDKCTEKEEIDKRWGHYRRKLQKMLREEIEKIDEKNLKRTVKHHLKKFKQTFLKPKAEFRHMQLMIQLDTSTRDYMKQFPGISQLIDIFVDGYAISNN